MKEDIAIKEVRDVRRRISAKYENSPKKLVKHYIALQKKHSRKITDTAALQTG